MTQPVAESRISQFWYPRPVFNVADVERSIRFYCDQLGFWKKWHQDTVCQVNRSDCEIILAQSDTRGDKTRLFIELTQAGLAELRQQIEEHSVPHSTTWWGYDCIRIVDPDGNELLFPIEGNSP